MADTDSTHARDNTAEHTYVLPVMQLEGESSRLVVTGCRTDDGDRCTLIVVHDRGGTWALYPHGAAQFGVRLPRVDAVKVAQAILDGAGERPHEFRTT